LKLTPVSDVLKPDNSRSGVVNNMRQYHVFNSLPPTGSGCRWV